MNEGGLGADPQSLLHLCIPLPRPNPPLGLVLSCWILDGVQGGAALPAASMILPWPLPSGLPLRWAVLQCYHRVERLLLLQVLPVPAALERMSCHQEWDCGRQVWGPWRNPSRGLQPALSQEGV